MAAGLVLAVVLAIGADTGHAQDPNVLTLGRVSGNPEKSLPRMRAMAEFLAESLGLAGGAAIVARDNEEMARLLREGRVDLLSETAMSALWFEENAGAQPLLHEWKRGVAMYESVIFVRHGSGVDTLEDLRGRVIAFEDRGSTTSFLVPLAMLRAAGLDPIEMKPHDVPPVGRVGYVFTRDEANVAAWVARGNASAGAVSDLDWTEIHEKSEGLARNLRIIVRSDPMLRSILLTGSHVSPDLRERIAATLQAAHENPAARDALSTYYEVKRYETIRGKSLRSMNATRDLYGVVRDVM